MEEYAINYIDDVKLDNWPRRRGPYLQFLTYLLILILRNGCYLSKLMIVKNFQSSYRVKNGQIFHLEKFIWILFQNILKELLYLINNSYCWCLRGRISLWGRSSVTDIRIVYVFVLSYTPYFHIVKVKYGWFQTRQDILTGLIPCMW